MSSQGLVYAQGVVRSCMGRGWVATGSTVSVAVVNDYHRDFLSTWIFKLKQVKQQIT